MRTDIVSQPTDNRIQKHTESGTGKLTKKNLPLHLKESIEIENRVSCENKMAAQPEIQNIEEAMREMAKVSYAIRHESKFAAKVHGHISSLRVLSLVE
jgi:hypothetical protein